jgi:5-bromo-4-chloroindolyl phosphate hydrolysis protein
MDHNSLVDIFFTLTGVAVIIITILIAIIAIYVISVFRTVRRIVRTAEFAANVVKEDFGELRTNLKEQGLNFFAFANFFKNIAKKRIIPNRKK